MKRLLKYTISCFVVIMLVPMAANAQTIKRSKQKTEQTQKSNNSTKSNKTTSKSTKTDKQAPNTSTTKKNKSKKADSTPFSKPSSSSYSSSSSSSHSEAASARKSEPTTYDVTFSCDASEASFANMYIDGHYWGRPQGTHPLKAGSYLVKIIADGYEDYMTYINVSPGNTSFHFRMTRLGTSGPYVPKVETITVKGISFDMIFVEGGKFTMGATSEQGKEAFDRERPIHEVTLSSYYIGKCEVTQELWQAIMGSNPSYFRGDLHQPVEMVNWTDCQEFITKLNSLTGKHFRLPTEAEWENAARGGKWSMGYKYAGYNKLDEVAWYNNNSAGKTHPVGQKSPNELGLYDMSGNVYEWCQDWYGSYTRNSQTNPIGPYSGTDRVWRGGCWGHDEGNCRVSVRNYYNPSGRYPYHGLRLAASSL